MDDDFKRLKLTAERMVEQSNRATQYPLFVIRNRVKRYVPDENFNFRGEGENYHDGYDDELGAPYNYVMEFDLTAGVFFTEKAALQHLAENGHHYDKPEVYVVGAWRNPEMQAVMRSIIKVDGQEVPTHYA